MPKDSFKSFADLECWKSCMDMRAKLFVMVIWLKAGLKMSGMKIDGVICLR